MSTSVEWIKDADIHMRLLPMISSIYKKHIHFMISHTAFLVFSINGVTKISTIVVIIISGIIYEPLYTME